MAATVGPSTRICCAQSTATRRGQEDAVDRLAGAEVDVVNGSRPVVGNDVNLGVIANWPIRVKIASVTEGQSLRRIGRLYADGQQRVVELVSNLPAGAAKSTATPACPEWSVHDVASHLTGVVDDITAGRLDGVATDAWTSAQVDVRRDHDTAQVLAEWNEKAPTFTAMLDDFPGWFGVQALMDLTVHEHDLRGALEAPGFRDSEALTAGLDLLLCAVLHPVACARGVPPLALVAGDQRWVIGGAHAATDGDPVAAALFSGSRPAEAGVSAAVQLTLTPFELFRAATGRRSLDQICAYDWTGDPEVYLPLFSCGPFHVRDSVLAD